MRAWLAPAGALFGAAAELRVGLYHRGLLPRARLAGPVISIGNLSVGGRGKTPLVAHCAEFLVRSGFPVAILSRGYKGSFRGETLVVADSTAVVAGAGEAGDEPVMLARRLPGVVVAVGRHRDRVGRDVEKRFGPRVHILDDGFQHLRLERDLDLVCVHSTDLLDRPLPAGHLREPVSALRRADLVLLSGKASDRPLGPPVLGLSRRIQGFREVLGGECPPPRRPFLFAGIAAPERFVSDVGSLVADVAGSRLFPDHHPFTPQELEGVVREAISLGADALVTTEKDATRIGEPPSGLPLLVLRIEAAVENEASFNERLLLAARSR